MSLNTIFLQQQQQMRKINNLLDYNDDWSKLMDLKNIIFNEKQNSLSAEW